MPYVSCEAASCDYPEHCQSDHWVPDSDDRTDCELMEIVALSDPDGPTEAEWAAYTELQTRGYTAQFIDLETQRIRMEKEHGFVHQ